MAGAPGKPRRRANFRDFPEHDLHLDVKAIGFREFRQR
jgi:hypothetical protein